jgi:diguanylate cyclase (GGDEF)-like protein
MLTTRFDELKATDQLPSPKGVALAILRLTKSETTTVQEIARVLENDPALSGHILKVANSAYAGPARPVASVREAVTRLGVRLVRNIALGFSLLSRGGGSACRGFDYDGFWSRSLAMGVAAQTIAQQSGIIAPPEAFTVGLLAQVGRLALASIYPEAYGEILAQPGAGDAATLAQLERERFATDHNELTAAMLGDWGLPKIYAQAVEHHEQPERATFSEGDPRHGLVQLLDFASRMAAVCVADVPERVLRVRELLADDAALPVCGSELAAFCDQVVAEWQDWGRLLQIGTHPVPPFAELAGRARDDEQTVEAAAGGEKPAHEPLTIVVADDDLIVRHTLTQFLTSAGHTVHSAADGAEALRLVLDIHPHLVITDWQMPGMDGTALVKVLRQTKMGRQLYILLLTGSEEDDTQVEAFEAGADDYVVKPFHPRILTARLRACTRVIHLQEEVRRDKDELRHCLSELGVANRKLQRAAWTDALTGLYNRRYAMDYLGRAWDEATRTGKPLACLLIDIDHFKRVNDTHGHDVGDQVLQETARVLRSLLRSTEVVCRLGGEEFVVIGSGLDQETALLCAERLRAGVEQQVIEAPTGALEVTLSIGVAVRTAHTPGPSQLLKEADEAVYAAKQGGRNQVCVAATSRIASLPLK